MPEEEFRLRAAIYWVSQEFAAYVRSAREQEEDADGRAALERKWFLLYAAKVVLQHNFPGDGWKAQLKKLYKGDWTMDGGKKGAAVTQIFNNAKLGVVMAYKNSKNFNKDFVHRNWMRSKDTPGEIADVLRTLLPSIPAIAEIHG